jgi:hypothetical protein
MVLETERILSLVCMVSGREACLLYIKAARTVFRKYRLVTRSIGMSPCKMAVIDPTILLTK